MALWRIDISGISTRYVEAGNAQEARELVQASLLDAIDLAIVPAAKVVSDLFEHCGPIQRKRLLAALDGLNAPSSRNTNLRLLRSLEKHRQQMDEWVSNNRRELPPIDPKRLEQVLRTAELEHVERNMQRLHSKRNSVHHA